ncbi:hypothetical protein [Kribbella deserti]|uniref:Uncharacterized protein n=1 Tax=Kribbella deserti TaxID=1926257 RepID=A0ABV6QSH3_9ACTN
MIAQRTEYLVETAREQQAPWLQDLEQVADGTARQELIRDIAAFRERYAIDSTAPLGPAPSGHDTLQLRTWESLRQQITVLTSTAPLNHSTSSTASEIVHDHAPLKQHP